MIQSSTCIILLSTPSVHIAGSFDKKKLALEPLREYYYWKDFSESVKKGDYKRIGLLPGGRSLSEELID